MSGGARRPSGAWMGTVPAGAVLVAAWLAVSSVTPSAQAPPLEERDVRPLGLHCGYDVDDVLGQAFYTHCDERGNVVVYINYRAGMIAEACFGPGTHPLGSSDHVEFAYYAGRSC